MKWLIALTIVMLSISMCAANVHNIRHKTGDDILYKLQAGNYDYYLIVFFHPNQGRDHLRSLNRHLIEKLENEFLAKNDIKDFYYATLDATNPTYANLMKQVDIDVDDLINSPALFLMKHGNGFIMTGPRAVGEMKQNLQELLSME